MKHLRATGEDVTESDSTEQKVQVEDSADGLAQVQMHNMLAQAKAEAEQQAKQIVDNARDEAAVIMLNAQEQAEQECSRAFQEGYAEGVQEGKRLYDERLAVKINEDDEVLKRVLREIYDEMKRMYDGLEEESVGLAIEIVRKVIAPAEEAVGGVFESLIRNALRQITPDGKIIIRVSPTEYDRFFSSGSSTIALDNDVVVAASVIRDATLAGGDCIIDAENETINAGLSSQLKYIALAFKEQTS